MTIRPATAADAASIGALIQQSPTLPQWSPDALAFEAFDMPASALQRGLLVAQDGTIVTGFAQFNLLLGDAELELMAVSPERRQQGIGRALLRAVLDEVRARGAERLYLEVRAGNLPALGLYRGAGLQMSGRRRAYYQHPVEDALLFQHVWVS